MSTEPHIIRKQVELTFELSRFAASSTFTNMVCDVAAVSGRTKSTVAMPAAFVDQVRQIKKFITAPPEVYGGQKRHEELYSSLLKDIYAYGMLVEIAEKIFGTVKSTEDWEEFSGFFSGEIRVSDLSLREVGLVVQVMSGVFASKESEISAWVASTALELKAGQSSAKKERSTNSAKSKTTDDMVRGLIARGWTMIDGALHPPSKKSKKSK